jgi:protein-disulfide isomerase
MSASGRIKGALELLSTVALIIAAAAFTWSVLFRGAPAASSPAQPVEEVKDTRIGRERLTNALGTGPIAILEFSDFECPYCGRHARETLPKIKRELIDTGEARYVSMHYPLEEIHPRAIQAGEAAECAGQQGQFWEMHDRLFGSPDALDPARVLAHATGLALDTEAFQRCLNEDAALPKIRADQSEGKRLAVSGTPAFFIGIVAADGGVEIVRRIRGAASIDLFAQQVALVKAEMISSTSRERVQAATTAASR